MNDKLLIGDDIMRKYFCIALILVLSISLVGCFYFSPQPKPIDTVVTFFDSINNKDINTAVSCLEPKYQRLFNLTKNFTKNFKTNFTTNTHRGIPTCPY